MVAVVVFEFSVMRCQPLRRALCSRRKIEEIRTNYFTFAHISAIAFSLIYQSIYDLCSW